MGIVDRAQQPPDRLNAEPGDIAQGPDEAQTAGAILGYNYQSSPFYDDSYRLLTGQGLSLEARGDSWLAKIYRQVIKGEFL